MSSDGALGWAGLGPASAAAPTLAAAAAAAAGAMPPGPPKRSRKRAVQGPAKAGGSGSGKKKKQQGERRVDEFGATVRWREKPSQAVRERMQRALPGSSHRLFLIDRTPLRPPGSPGGAAEEFCVMGATGNVYTVTLGCHPRCTCPDFGKGHVCKHLLFVQMRVLRLPQDEPLIWQLALLPQEADEVLSGQRSQSARTDGDGSEDGAAVLAPAAVRQQYQRLQSPRDLAAGSKAGAEEEGAGGGGMPGQRPIEGDCPICFDQLLPAGEPVSFCTACCNNVHRSCIQRWTQRKREQGAAVTCPLCRAPWLDGTAPAAALPSSGTAGQYLNLGQYSEAHRGGTGLAELYGDRAVWTEHQLGMLGRGEAADIWRGLGH